MNRRRLISTLAPAAALLAAACGKGGPGGGGESGPGGKPPSVAFDAKVLDAGFPALARRAQPGFLNFGLLTTSREVLWCWNATARMPLQSVMKAPLAAAALAEVDAGRLRLAERIPITAMDLSPLASAIDRAWPTPPAGHAMNLPAVDLIALAVQQSDNTAADVIMHRIGGPGAVTAWLRLKDIDDIRIDRYERELQQDVAGMPPFQPEWKDLPLWIAARDAVPAAQRDEAMNAYLADPRDTATVPAALSFLHRLALGELLSPASTRLLLTLMSHTATGLGRLRAGLPPGASLAHKTGSSPTDLGFTPATNDIGIATLADGRGVALAAFLAGSTATEAERDRLIADAARLAVKAMG